MTTEYLKKATPPQATIDAATGETVQRMLAEIKAEGREAVARYARDLDGYKGKIVLDEADIAEAIKAVPQTVREGLEKIITPIARVRAQLDDQGRATVKGLIADRYTPEAGEVILPLKQLKGKWVLVTDAYFFPEGTGKAFERAKFGDFRVLPDGRALLVGLADADGKPIPVPRALPSEERGQRANDGLAAEEAASAVEAADEAAAAVEAAQAVEAVEPASFPASAR